MQSDDNDDLARLSPRSRVPQRGRGRLGVGAALVLLIATLVAAVIVTAFAQPAERPVDVGVSGPSGETSGATSFDVRTPTASAAPAMFVHVLGAVHNPGLFEVAAGARVMDVIAQAGGLTESADPAGVNLARVLADGEQLYVPGIGESPPPAPSGTLTGPAAAPAAPVNINTAEAAELDTLPHVGPIMAQRIIDYRAANGPFTSVDDLRNVAGIGDKTFEALKDQVSV